MKRSEDFREITKALRKSQGEIVQPKKDSKNPFYKSAYSDLPTCWEACKNVINSNGISLLQTTTPKEDGMLLETTLIHDESGQWIQSDFPISFFMPPDKNNPSERRMNSQEIGSAITYGRRFSLCCVLMLCPEDDDGNAASGKQSIATRRIITAQQAEYLESLLSQCPDAYVQNVKSHIAKPPISANSIRMLPVEAFENMKSAIEMTIAKKKEVANV